MSRGVDTAGSAWVAAALLLLLTACAPVEPRRPARRPGPDPAPPMIIESPDDVEVELLEPPPDMGGEADPGRPPRAVRRRTPASAPITLERVPAGPTTVAQVFGMDPGAVAVRVNGEPALVEPDGRWAVRLAVGPDRRLEVEITDADGRTTTRSQTLDGAER